MSTDGWVQIKTGDLVVKGDYDKLSLSEKRLLGRIGAVEWDRRAEEGDEKLA